jgi:hypothetical protein
MSLLPFFQWIDTQAWSTALHESMYMYPWIESTHVLTLMLFAGSTAMLDLRLLGVILHQVPVSEFVERLLPWTRLGFAVMVVTGLLLTYAIPVRTYQSIWFRGKLIMLVLAAINIWFFHYRVYPNVADWDANVRPPWPARRAAIASLVLWAGIIVFGRFIAYNWYDCDIQPQPAFVNWFAGCVVSPTE